jgi:predicted nucleic acid-binding Zn ribbon protein
MTENDPGYNCDICKNPMIRVYSLSGITFKGSGFYRTDK